MGLSWTSGFRAYRQLPAIQLGFLLHPWCDGLFLNVNFGTCHEFGHLVGPSAETELQEAWAHFFALYVLRALSRSDLLSGPWHLVLRRDYVLARMAFGMLQYTWGTWQRIARTALLLLAVVDCFGTEGLNRLLDAKKQSSGGRRTT